jgi:sugar-specific transcriptional regulator TrmB
MSVKETVAREQIIARLKELELPTHEASIYVTLLMHPNIAASVLCKETGIPDSKIYYSLEGLSQKGMLLVQKGNPNIYLPVSPKEAISNLKNRLTESLEEKLREADVLVDMLTPIFDSAEKLEDLEVAYIIRGQKNIINRMKALIENARREITIFISHPAVLNSLKTAMIDAKERRKIKLNIAMTQEVFKKEDTSDLGEIRLMCCVAEQSLDSLGMIISDMKTLLTVSDWMGEAAMLTQDQNLVKIAKDYYDSPSCCTTVNSNKKRYTSASRTRVQEERNG